MQPVNWEYIADKYGWLITFIVVLVANGDKIVGWAILFANAIAKIFRQGKQAGVNQAIVSSNQDTTIIKHELDTETMAQSK